MLPPVNVETLEHEKAYLSSSA